MKNIDFNKIFSENIELYSTVLYKYKSFDLLEME